MDYEAWRPALVAYLEAEGHHMPASLDRIRKGYPLTEDNCRIIRGLAAAFKVAA